MKRVKDQETLGIMVTALPFFLPTQIGEEKNKRKKIGEVSCFFFC